MDSLCNGSGYTADFGSTGFDGNGSRLVFAGLGVEGFDALLLRPLGSSHISVFRVGDSEVIGAEQGN